MRLFARTAMLLVTSSLAACASDSRGANGSPGGAGGSAGSSPIAGSAGTAGASGTAGTSAGTGGSNSSGSAGTGGVTGGAGAGGSSGGAEGGISGAAGTAGAGGGGLWGPDGPKKQWSCPAGPFPDQVLSGAVDACPGFKLLYNWNEGPTWVASQKAFFFSNFPIGSPDGGDIIKFTPGVGCETWLANVGCNGLGVSPSGKLLGACQTPRAIMEYDPATKQGRTIATMAEGQMLDSPNDLIARSDGNIYFSNRTAENGNRPVGLGEALVRIDPMGVTSVIQKGGLNGVALSPDESKLYVVGMGTFALDASGNVGQKGDPTPGGDGLAIDCAGTVSNNGTNSAFGGDDGKTLFVVGGGTAAKVMQATVPGLP